MGIERGSPSSRPTSPLPAELPTDRPCFIGSVGVINGIDETAFDEAADTKLDPNDPMRSIHPAERPARHPKRYSSLDVLNKQRLRYLKQEQPRTFYESPSSSESDAPSDHTQRPRPEITDSAAAMNAVIEERDSSSMRRASGQMDRSKLPLPPTPPQAATKRSSVSSQPLSKLATASIASAVSTGRASSTKSKRSSRSTRKSPVWSNASTPNDMRRPSMMSDATWEDDVDFCYQQEAESTCDFDWHGFVPVHESSIADSDGGVRLSAWLAPSPMSASQSSSALQRQQQQSDNANAIKRASFDDQTTHKRGLSVGHRGFLAARRGSSDLTQKKGAAPHMLKPPPCSTQVGMLSPVFSVTGADEATGPPISPGTLHFHGFDSASLHRASAEYLSDPESIRTGGSKHRKSSSYGSYESRPAPANSDKTRWSMASSSNSVPDLLHSKRRSKSSLHKSIISRPLESLPQSPGVEDPEESTIVPRASQVEPMRNTFVMRRPQSPGERAVLQAAGHTVQRGRPATPSRFSRLMRVEEGRQQAAAAANGWI